MRAGARVAQVGGNGIHAVKLLLGGASAAWLVTPMIEEALFGVALAEASGVAERFRAVMAVAEEMPFGP